MYCNGNNHIFISSGEAYVGMPCQCGRTVWTGQVSEKETIINKLNEIIRLLQTLKDKE